jgi:hypothetical protein
MVATTPNPSIPIVGQFASFQTSRDASKDTRLAEKAGNKHSGREEFWKIHACNCIVGENHTYQVLADFSL